MKKIFVKICAILILGLAACNQDEFFEIKRPQETQWVNTVTYDQGLASAYALLTYSDPGTIQMREFITSGTSQLLPETSTGVPWNELYNRLFDQDISSNKNAWRDGYKAITLCNAALQLDEEKGGNPFVLKVDGSDYKDNYVRQVGEYHFLRAYAYWNLLKIFAPPYNHNGDNNTAYIPFKLKVPSSKDEIISEKLGTTEEIYNQIIADLRIASDKLPGAFNSSTMHANYECGRATKFTAAALLAKVLFLKGDYAGAKQETDFVIAAAENEGRFTLEAPIEAFNKNVIKNIPKEVIWEFNTGDPTVSGASNYMYFGMIISLNFRDTDNGGRGVNMVKSGWNQFTLSYWALDKIDWMTDPLNGDYSLTPAASNDLRFKDLYYYLLAYNPTGDPLVYETVSAHAAVDKPQLYIDKYFRGTPGDGRYTKFPLIRLADIYLIRAWLNWKSGQLSNAAADLNKVWNRANPGAPDKYHVGNVNHDAIFAEYVKEMSGEGWTLDFIMATQMDIPAGDRNVSPIAPPYSDWKWVIPASEVSLNPNYQ
ncbi:MAG: RagB/SusD family nutrient uptake outer membrane protein [Prolixibacteraceae bacterium]